MNEIEKQLTRLYHTHRVETYGAGTVQALGWKEERSQRSRFEVLAGVGSFEDCSVLDLGCGHGDLKGFLDERASGLTFVGLDQMRPFIVEARRRYGSRPNTHFVHCDFAAVDFPTVDYVVASGVMGYRCENPDFHRGIIARMYRAARRAAAFNMLDVATFPEHALLVGHDRDQVMQACAELCPDVELITGYLDHDFTIVLRRDRSE